jgi:hypothetical protein
MKNKLMAIRSAQIAFCYLKGAMRMRDLVSIVFASLFPDFSLSLK